jgi:hypothetical protein
VQPGIWFFFKYSLTKSLIRSAAAIRAIAVNNNTTSRKNFTDRMGNSLAEIAISKIGGLVYWC